MGESDLTAFKRIMVANGELHGKEITQTLFQMYFSCLKEYSIKAVESAFEAHTIDTERGRFFPKPADIIEQLKKWQSEKNQLSLKVNTIFTLTDQSLSRISTFSDLLR